MIQADGSDWNWTSLKKRRALHSPLFKPTRTWAWCWIPNWHSASYGFIHGSAAWKDIYVTRKSLLDRSEFNVGDLVMFEVESDDQNSSCATRVRRIEDSWNRAMSGELVDSGPMEQNILISVIISWLGEAKRSGICPGAVYLGSIVL